MMKRITFYTSFLFLAVIFTACDDIFEKDISAETPEVIAPADGQSISGSDLTFWWDYMNGADFYQLQIARPGFDLIEKSVADTIMETNKFSITLVAGIYEWRIRACNSAYCTGFLSRTLTVTGN